MKPIDPTRIKRILVIRTDRLGDLLLNVPAVRALKQRFPGARLTMLVQPHLTETVAGNPDVDAVISYDKGGVERGWRRTFGLVRRLRREQFDLVAILNPAKRSNIIVFLAGIPVRVGYDRKWGFLLTHRFPDLKQRGEKHEVEYNLDLVRMVGATTDDARLFMPCSPEDEAWVGRWLEERGGLSDEPLVAVHPGTSSRSKRWPLERFIAVVDRLEELGVRVVLIGGSEETAGATQLMAQARALPISAVGALTLRQLAALLRRCVVLVSNDSGPVHVAAAVGTPTVVVFGRTLPGVSARRWGPWGDGHTVVQHDVGCVTCDPDRCPIEYQCLLSVSPEEVIEAVLRILQGARGKGQEKTGSLPRGAWHHLEKG